MMPVFIFSIMEKKSEGGGACIPFLLHVLASLLFCQLRTKVSFRAVTRNCFHDHRCNQAEITIGASRAYC